MISSDQIAQCLNGTYQEPLKCAFETGKYDLSLLLAFKIVGLFGKRIKQIFTPDE